MVISARLITSKKINQERKSTMLDPMWLWGILGLVLLALEMFLGTLYLLWFGISAFCMGIAMLILPTLPIAIQLFLYSALSLGSLAIWKMYFQSTSHDLRVGQSQGDEIGRTGTITETVQAMDVARAAGWGMVVSARSGETEDTAIVHLATGWDTGQLKVGSFARSERMAKWNEGLRIEEAMGGKAVFAGRQGLPVL
jgi:membrane protein implicated in regulation of membrane protease activity